MRSHGAADDVVRRSDVGHPVPESLVHRILQGATAALHGDHGGSQLTHTEAVQLLSLRVDLAHVHNAFQVQQGTGCCRRYAVLARTSLGNDALLSQLHGEQCLSDSVVDLVGASVGKLFPLEPDLCASAEGAEALGMIDRGRPANVLPAKASKLRLKDGIHLPLCPGDFELVVSNHQGFWNEATAEHRAPEVPFVGMLLPLCLLLLAAGLLTLSRRLCLYRRQRPAAQCPHEASHCSDPTFA
mmetsp:Transcript_35316/g.81481  ORF Transcript_35316/g.81481 Transcript_35316/m.81481 type:complete len:242 (+) Transcript_35316:787-1512(+)